MRWIFRVFGALVVAALLLAGGLLLLPGEKIAQVAVDQIRAATGRQVSVEGGVELSFYPVLGVRTGKVTISNADWSDEPLMLSARGLSIGVETGALFRGQVRVKALELVGPEMLLERSRDGRFNWEIERGTGGAGGRGMAFALDRLEVSDGSLRYVDHSDGSRQRFDKLDLTLLAPDLAGRAQIELTAHPAGTPVALRGAIDGFLGFLDGAPVPVEATLTAGGGTLEFAGRAGAGGDAEGRLSADLPRTKAFAAALGLGAVAPPEGMGRAIRGEGLIVLTDGKALALRKMALRLDDNAITGDADITLDGKTQLRARLRAGALDFAGAPEAGGGTGGGQAESSGWSTAPIDASGLGALDGQVRLTAESIDLGRVKLDATDVTVTIDRARAVFSLNDVAAYGGAFGGEFVMNNRSGLSVGGKLSMRGVETKDLLSDMAGITRLSGKADGNLGFLGVGQSLNAIMNSLQGDGRIAMGRGVIAGMDLDRLMRSGDGSGGTTIFDSLGASFTMAGGNLVNSDLKLALPGIEATGTGRIGLGARDIDYLFTPVALKARGGRGLAIPVRIRGPWSAPRITPDMGAAVDLNLAEEKKQVEEKVEQKVRETLRKELDVEVQEGEKVEDALKRKAEEELMRGLQKLLE
ncbi:AsmA family protein [Marimonas lutisalis]|uniref:AsmA family protein n=1 Tax=Marimonas lutisalis TaxID=2545756 RepID=UPI0010F552BB|nr:AsmA family protein [Marimonas lutisalis]